MKNLLICGLMLTFQYHAEIKIDKIALFSYNDLVDVWEPLIEPWGFTGKVLTLNNTVCSRNLVCR